MKFTANFSGCLLDRLADEKETSFLDRLKFLVKKGRLELTGSAAYHGFLPLLPADEVARQIKENEKILKKHFGKNFKPAGFFLPEMAYSPEVARVIKRLGYQWIIVDEISYSGTFKKRPDFNSPYIDSNSGLRVIFRNRQFSSAYPPDKILATIKQSAERKRSLLAKESPIITATDAELYGLRHEDPTGEIEKLAKQRMIKTMTMSQFLKSFERQKPNQVNLASSSWESSPADLAAKKPYLLWINKNNKIQTYLWRLANLALSLRDKYKKDKNVYWYRWHLVRGLASCTFWWASAHDFKPVFGPYAWSPDEIERGLEDLVRSVRSLSEPRTKKVKLEAENYYLKIKKLIWEEHWRKHWHKQYE